MKSAIFSESERPSKPRGFRRTLSQKKAKSSSPFSPAAATPNSPAPTTPVSAPKSSAWNVDDMISSYLLSPTLPPQFAKPDFPDLYDNDEHDPYEHDEDTTRSPHASDIDNLPISLLSPTLPTMFEPKSEHGGSETSSKSPRKSPSKARVRWVNKLNDSKKPRFLVRMTVSSSSLRNVTPKTALKGLGITEAAASDSKPTSPAGSPKNEAALYWQKLAKSAMSHADRVRSKDPLFSVVIQFDWILCLVIANDYEEKASNPSSTHIGKIWTTFLDDIPHSFLA
ncbi:hypothetical protein CXQ85_001321 [Candidozyma haemuli]|uniref:Uncharacterized protein n=1 Tax=Candidozyma haemuli TaxID=45357 RepID=A0A2V1AL31_9ASCO|nr:hypothetical protein CXQ85_001321 [[Candida] haemuloni]PVH19027.1 hypothetical protein CXQ85_001321 [[Candida] haemuloni]